MSNRKTSATGRKIMRHAIATRSLIVIFLSIAVMVAGLALLAGNPGDAPAYLSDGLGWGVPPKP
jgi:hypothetical protein